MSTENIRYRRDGSIDTTFYTARGRRLRSETAHALATGFLFHESGSVARPREALVQRGWRRYLKRRLLNGA